MSDLLWKWSKTTFWPEPKDHKYELDKRGDRFIIWAPRPSTKIVASCHNEEAAQTALRLLSL